MSNPPSTAHHRRACATWLAMLLAMFAQWGLASLALAQPWHAAGWRERAVYSVPKADGAQGVDVAAVTVWHAGSASASGNDFRVYDSAGRPLPYELAYHHPGRDSLLLVRCDKAGGDASLFIYWGKDDAPYDVMRTVQPKLGTESLTVKPPQPGPAAGGWVPRAGLVLITMRRPATRPNPETPAAMAALIRASDGLDGGDLCTNISDAVNRWGDSGNFISVYRGWITIPSAASHTFCTASNEASFSFINGEELIHWPGAHTEVKGKHGEFSGSRTLASGPHYLEYYHENMSMQSVAFLGYRSPGAAAFGAIPTSWFPRPHTAVLQRAEHADGKRTLMMRVELTDSRWPPDRYAQHTRYRFIADAGADTIDLTKWDIRWSAGDGVATTGGDAQHVYLITGDYKVTMTAVGPAGERTERAWPITVFRITQTGGFANGDATAYAALTHSYDPSAMPARHVAELARLRNESGERQGALAAASSAVARPDIDAKDLPEMHLMLARLGTAPNAEPDAPRITPAQTDVAINHLKQSIASQTEPVARTQAMAELVRMLATNQSDIAAAEALFKDTVAELPKTFGSNHAREAVRRASIAIGDAHLYAGHLDQAAVCYQRAESMAKPVIPPQVRATKSGAYPEAIEQAMANGQLDNAAVIVEQWRNDLPSDQLKGALFFYMAEIEAVRGVAVAVIRPMRMAIELGQGAEFEAEARWRLAEAYKTLGQTEAWKRELGALVKSGIDSPYRTQARIALEEQTP